MILRITHGYEVKETNDPFVELADKATEQFSLATAPGGFLVDLLPACKPPLCLLMSESFTQSCSALCPTLVPGCELQAKGAGMVENAARYGRWPVRIRKAANGRHSTT